MCLTAACGTREPLATLHVAEETHCACAKEEFVDRISSAKDRVHTSGKITRNAIGCVVPSDRFRKRVSEKNFSVS